MKNLSAASTLCLLAPVAGFACYVIFFCSALLPS